MVKVYYDFTKKQDYIDYLSLIIEHLEKYLSRYKYYHIEIKEICLNKYKELKPDATEISVDLILELVQEKNYNVEREKYKLIPYYKYIKLSDMVSYINLKILNIIGDRTKEAVSYLKFRDKVKERLKKGLELDFELDELTQEISEKLNKCNLSRNYVAHIGDSVFISQMEYRKNQMEDYTKQLGIDFKFIKDISNNFITVNKYDYVDVEWIYHMYLNYKNTISIYLSILQQIKRDHKKMTGKKVDVYKISNRNLPFDYSQISRDSVDMQIKPKNNLKY
ncbi:hypothetical protein CD798_08605 [Bacillaceae bacterium SAOS 7]|nr:hypothetical protein CD798_08605 [Bacillaceae bacterium SAOS 7]